MFTLTTGMVIKGVLFGAAVIFCAYHKEDRSSNYSQSDRLGQPKVQTVRLEMSPFERSKLNDIINKR